MNTSFLRRALTATVAAGALSATALVGVPALAADGGNHLDDHGVGEMGEPGTSSSARTTDVTVDPATGPDFEMPFVCGDVWTGSTRSSHSPSAWSIDFNAPDDVGSPALASARGVVSKAAYASGYGNYIVVDHGGGYSTLYAHLQSTQAAVGQVVDQGAIVGRVGGTGNVTGPHLHFEERLNGQYFAPYFHRTRYQFGTTSASQNCPDIPITGDWDGDGRTDLGVYRQFPTKSRFVTRLNDRNSVTYAGQAGVVPVTGDWDGNRSSELGWRQLGSTTFTLRRPTGATFTADMGGLARDVPLTGRWTMNPQFGIGLNRPEETRFTWRLPDLTKKSLVFGAAGQQPVTGVWGADGITRFGTYDTADGTWRLLSGNGTVASFKWGQPTDLPITGDWNGDGITDVGIWRPSDGTFRMRIPASPRATTTIVKFGIPRG